MFSLPVPWTPLRQIQPRWDKLNREREREGLFTTEYTEARIRGTRNVVSKGARFVPNLAKQVRLTSL